jgi:hypothetical protein
LVHHSATGGGGRATGCVFIVRFRAIRFLESCREYFATHLETAALDAYRQWDADAGLEERAALDAFAAHGARSGTMGEAAGR